MRKVEVNLGNNSYEIYVGSGILTQVGCWLKEKGFSGKLVVITDPTVKRLYGDALSYDLTK